MKQFLLPNLAFRDAGPPAPGPAGECRLYFDSVINALMISRNGGPFQPIGEGEIVTLGLLSDGYALGTVTSLDFSPQFAVDMVNGAASVYSAGPDPSGFVDRLESSIAFDELTRTFELSPVSGQFRYFTNGRPGKSAVPMTTTWPDVEGRYWFYINNDQQLVTTNQFDPHIIFKYAVVATGYWDQSAQKMIYQADERHGCYMDSTTHSYLHNTRGSVWVSGLALNNFDVDGDGSLDQHVRFGCEDGYFYDEDILHSIANGDPQTLITAAEIPTFYRTGAAGDWNKKDYDGYPIIWSDGVVFTGASGRAAWNEYTGGAWQLTETDNNKFFLLHVLATNDIQHPVISVLGENQYNSAADARGGASTELLSLTGLPFAEMVALGSVIYQADAYANATKCRIRSTDTGAAYFDLRTTPISAGTGALSHDSLIGLTDQDHPASAIYTDTAQFDGYVLTAAETDVQLALNVLGAEVGAIKTAGMTITWASNQVALSAGLSLAGGGHFDSSQWADFQWESTGFVSRSGLTLSVVLWDAVSSTAIAQHDHTGTTSDVLTTSVPVGTGIRRFEIRIYIGGVLIEGDFGTLINSSATLSV